jgi:hypothetical protein
MKTSVYVQKGDLGEGVNQAAARSEVGIDGADAEGVGFINSLNHY